MLIAISILLTVSSLAVAVWAAFSGQLATMDGILLMAVCLALALIFSLNARSALRGEAFQGWLKSRKHKSDTGAQEKQARV